MDTGLSQSRVMATFGKSRQVAQNKDYQNDVILEIDGELLWCVRRDVVVNGSIAKDALAIIQRAKI